MDEHDFTATPPVTTRDPRGPRDEKIPLPTIAPKFPGRFNKGVDYVG